MGVFDNLPDNEYFKEQALKPRPEALTKTEYLQLDAIPLPSEGHAWLSRWRRVAEGERLTHGTFATPTFDPVLAQPGDRAPMAGYFRRTTVPAPLTPADKIRARIAELEARVPRGEEPPLRRSFLDGLREALTLLVE